MSSRGRAGRPNLALAGKREDKSQVKKKEDTSNKSSRGRGGPRGARGGSDRGRGRGGGQKQDLIQTGGVFSEGLGGDFPSRRKERESDVTQFTVAKRSTGEKKSDVKNENGEDKKGKEGKTSFKGWDDLWKSDDDDDKKELDILLPRGLISDYKRGTILPLVLPKDDERQFVEVLHKKVKDEILSDDEEDKKESKVKNERLNDSAETSVKKQDVTLMYSQKAADLIKGIPRDENRPEFLLVQLPSVVGALCKHNQSLEAENNVNAMEVDESTADTPAQSTVEGLLPRGKTIGKLRITKKGKVILKIGDYNLNVTKTISGGQQQSVVLLETDPVCDSTEDAMMSPGVSNSGFYFGGNSNNVKEKKKNSLYHLGNVKDSLMASMVWGSLNEEKEDVEEEKMDVEKQKVSDEGTCPELAKEIGEMLSVQKSWAEQADRWASGH